MLVLLLAAGEKFTQPIRGNFARWSFDLNLMDTTTLAQGPRRRLQVQRAGLSLAGKEG